MISMLQDFWGNPALDFGSDRELEKKYPDKVFVGVTNKPFGDSYVLFVCDPDEEEKADKFLKDYNTMMEARGITAYGAGTSLGSNLLAARMEGFQGGAEF
jgi:hypothetical protein